MSAAAELGMIDSLLSLSLPALRAIYAIARGAQNDNDLRTAGVSRSCVTAATRELRDLDLIVTTPGRCAAPGLRGIASTHVLRRPIADLELADVSLSQLSLSQARVRLATCRRTYQSTIALANVCGLTAGSTRDALRFFAKHTYDLHSTPRKSAPPNCILPPEVAPRQVAQHTAEACGSKLKTELNTVSNTKEKQQTAVVVNFSIHQKLIEYGISSVVAAQLIAQDEVECALQIERISKLKNTPKNCAGYLRSAITMRFRDKINKNTTQLKKYETLKLSDFSIEEEKNREQKAQEDFDRAFELYTNNSSR